jgi:hypothetical protein
MASFPPVPAGKPQRARTHTQASAATLAEQHGTKHAAGRHSSQPGGQFRVPPTAGYAASDTAVGRRRSTTLSGHHDERSVGHQRAASGGHSQRAPGGRRSTATSCVIGRSGWCCRSA